MTSRQFERVCTFPNHHNKKQKAKKKNRKDKASPSQSPSSSFSCTLLCFFTLLVFLSPIPSNPPPRRKPPGGMLCACFLLGLLFCSSLSLFLSLCVCVCVSKCPYALSFCLVSMLYDDAIICDFLLLLPLYVRNPLNIVPWLDACPFFCGWTDRPLMTLPTIFHIHIRMHTHTHTLTGTNASGGGHFILLV